MKNANISTLIIDMNPRATTFYTQTQLDSGEAEEKARQLMLNAERVAVRNPDGFVTWEKFHQNKQNKLNRALKEFNQALAERSDFNEGVKWVLSDQNRKRIDCVWDDAEKKWVLSDEAKEMKREVVHRYNEAVDQVEKARDAIEDAKRRENAAWEQVWDDPVVQRLAERAEQAKESQETVKGGRRHHRMKRKRKTGKKQRKGRTRRKTRRVKHARR